MMLVDITSSLIYYLDNVSASADFSEAQLFIRYFYIVISIEQILIQCLVKLVHWPAPHATLSNIEIFLLEIQEILIMLHSISLKQ